jgi:hypothetical protein
MIPETLKEIVGAVLALSLAASPLMAQQAGAGRPQEKTKSPIKIFVLAGKSNMEGHV